MALAGGIAGVLLAVLSTVVVQGDTVLLLPTGDVLFPPRIAAATWGAGVVGTAAVVGRIALRRRGRSRRRAAAATAAVLALLLWLAGTGVDVAARAAGPWAASLLTGRTATVIRPPRCGGCPVVAVVRHGFPDGSSGTSYAVGRFGVGTVFGAWSFTGSGDAAIGPGDVSRRPGGGVLTVEEEAPGQVLRFPFHCP